MAGGKEGISIVLRHDQISREYFYTPPSILIAICKIYGQIYYSALIS
ncbi:MAG: hypothetical protein LBR79_05575 [Oscillospiraceae bacterium]|nr:hypothetical protein [Oscillospiraceae bacterium]